LNRVETENPTRGQILSSDDFPLALNQTNYQISIYKPNLKQDLDSLLQKLDSIHPGFIVENQKNLDNFKNNLKPNKVLVLLGARRVGKTQLIKKYLETVEEKVLQLNGEDLNDARLLEERTLENYTRLFQNIGLLVIDEAQAVQDIGLILKFIVDHIEGIKVIATGSSMFDLANKLGEPLVGRKNTLFLYPLSQIEFSN
jgi:predicted AAA+ superfamily ATPase